MSRSGAVTARRCSGRPLLGEFHQPGRHPVQFLAGVGKGHRLAHVRKVPPHLEVDHLGAAAELLEPEFFHGGRGFQARDQHPGGSLILPCLRAAVR